MIENNTKWALGLVSVLVAVIVSGGIAMAQTTPATTTPNPSDYAVDVSQGQQTLQSDTEAAVQAKEVNDSENDEGGVDNEPVEVKESIEPAEAEEAIEPAEVEEQSDSSKDSDNSASSDSDGVKTSEGSGSIDEN